jgi:hypothetical protein
MVKIGDENGGLRVCSTRPTNRMNREGSFGSDLARLHTSSERPLSASDPLPSVPATIGLLDRQPMLGPGDGDYSLCPLPSLSAGTLIES